MLELRHARLVVRQQYPIPVFYRNGRVGEYFADLLVENSVTIMAAVSLAKEHELQLVNYLSAAGFDAGLLINFGRSVAVRRKFRKYRDPADPEKSC